MKFLIILCNKIFKFMVGNIFDIFNFFYDGYFIRFFYNIAKKENKYF